MEVKRERFEFSFSPSFTCKNFLFLLFLLNSSCFAFQKLAVENKNRLITPSSQNKNLQGQQGGQSLPSRQLTAENYVWRSQEGRRQMAITFSCDKEQVKIQITDPEQKDYVQGYPAYINMSVQYSPVLEAKKDLRFVNRGGVFLKSQKVLPIDQKHIPSFLDNLQSLHQQDIKNKKKVKGEYDKAVENCESLKGQKKDYCYKTLTTGAYMMDNQATIMINVVSQVIAPKNTKPPQAPAKFYSTKLFENLKQLPCY